MQSPELMLNPVAVSQLIVGGALTLGEGLGRVTLDVGVTVGGGKSVLVKVEVRQMLKPSSL